MQKVWITAVVTVLIVLSWALTPFAAEMKQPPAGGEIDKKEAAEEPVEERITVKIPFTSPLFSSFPLAIVNDEQITIQDINSALTSSHEEVTDPNKHVAKIDYSNILKRLISIRLIIQEAKNMGLGDLPGIKSSMDKFSETTMRTLLVEEVEKDVKADDKDVEELYNEVTKEWKIKSVMFRKEEDAKKMEEDMKAGKSFDEMVTKVLDEKLAEGSREGGYVKPRDLQPEIEKIVSKMALGDVSSIIKIGEGTHTGYALLKLEDMRHTDDPDAKERARDVILAGNKVEEVKDFKRALIKKSAKIDFKFIKKLDYESEKSNIEKLSKDKRTIVEIKGEEPITVADLTRGLKEKFYHGLETAIKSKQVNKSKLEIVDQLVEKRLFIKEAKDRGIDKTDIYENKLREYEDSLIFGIFVQKVLIPDIKVSEEEMKTYYSDHADDYTYPEMIKLEDLVFASLPDAESALAKLKQGADITWMKENAEGQVEKDAEGLLSFSGNVLITSQLPEGLHKALSGVRSDDFRLYESPEGHYYVLYIRELIPSKIKPFQEVREAISKNLFNKSLNQSMEEWAEKLRESADIKIYLADTEPEKYTNKSN